MTALTQALGALNQVGVLETRSSPALISAVKKHATKTKRDAPTKKGLAPTTALNSQISLRFIDALHGLAESTGLSYAKSIVPYQREWAVRRYIGLCSAPNPYFELTALGSRVSANYRRVLSEDLGIAFGIMAAQAWCRASMPGARVTALDIDVVLGRGYQQVGKRRVRVRQDGDKRPDYLILAADPTSPGAVICRLLECKGTAAAGHMTEQLRAALCQLDTVKVGGKVPLGLAACTYSGNGPWNLKALDPGADDVRFDIDADLVGLAMNAASFQVTRRRNGVLDISDLRRLGAVAMSASMASLAAFGGNDLARDLYFPPDLEGSITRDATPDRRTLATPAGEIRGTRSQVAIGDERFEVIQGLEAGVDDALTFGSMTDVIAAQNRLDWQNEAPEEDPLDSEDAIAEWLELDEPLEATEVWSYGNKGTALGVRRL